MYRQSTAVCGSVSVPFRTRHRMTTLSSKTARSKLTVRREPYWVQLGRGAYLGYRAGPKPGSPGTGTVRASRTINRSVKSRTSPTPKRGPSVGCSKRVRVPTVPLLAVLLGRRWRVTCYTCGPSDDAAPRGRLASDFILRFPSLILSA